MGHRAALRVGAFAAAFIGGITASLILALVVLADDPYWGRYVKPTDWWLEVTSVHVDNGKAGEPIVMHAQRAIKRPFRATWQVTVRQWSPWGLIAYCNASGTSNYAVDAAYPDPLTLDWWTGGECAFLEPGAYLVDTSWRITIGEFVPEKDVTVRSNAFEVTR